jgi:hypothetical protein
MIGLYRIGPVDRYRVGPSAELLYFRMSDTVLLLPSNVAALTACCTTFKPLSEHARMLQGLLPTPLSFLEGLAKSGVFVCYDRIMDPVHQLERSEPNASISCVAIPTCDRPRELQRALESYVACAHRYSRKMRFFVADDSLHSESRRRNKEVVCRVAKSSDCKFYYAGLEEKTDFVQALASQSGIPRKTLEFALFGPRNCRLRIGSNRNAILLHTLGELVLTVDDDSICMGGTFSNPDERDSLALGSEWDSPDHWFFASRGEAMRSVELTQLNIFEEHEKLLGRSLISLLKMHRDRFLGIRNPCPHLMKSLLSHEGRVPVTFTGTLGDSGKCSRGWIATTRNRSTRARLTSSEGAYRIAVTSREVARQFNSLTIVHHGAPVATAMGVDNRDLLPPFVPGYRNSDGLFAVCLSRCMSNTYFGHIPWVLAHDPPLTHQDDAPWPLTVRVWDVVGELIAAMPETASALPLRESMASLGRHFVEVALSDRDEFRSTVRTISLRRASRLLSTAELLLAEFHQEPSYWAQDINHHMSLLRQTVQEPGYGLPLDLLQERGPEEVIPALQEFITEFGLLLISWSTIAGSAQSLKEHGVTMGTEVK